MDIILVPGFWLDASSWEEVTPPLVAAGHQVHPLTLPGLESADAPRAGIGLRTHIDAVVAKIDTFDAPVVLVGHSGGGAIIHGAVDARVLGDLAQRGGDLGRNTRGLRARDKAAQQFLVLDADQAVLYERAGLPLHFTAGRRGDLRGAVADGLVRGVLHLAAAGQGDQQAGSGNGGTGQGREAEFHSATLASESENQLTPGGNLQETFPLYAGTRRGAGRRVTAGV